MKQDNGKKANAWTRNVPVPVTIASSSVPRPACEFYFLGIIERF